MFSLRVHVLPKPFRIHISTIEQISNAKRPLRLEGSSADFSPLVDREFLALIAAPDFQRNKSPKSL